MLVFSTILILDSNLPMFNFLLGMHTLLLFNIEITISSGRCEKQVHTYQPARFKRQDYFNLLVKIVKTELPEIPLALEDAKWDRAHKTMLSLSRQVFGTIWSKHNHGHQWHRFWQEVVIIKVVRCVVWIYRFPLFSWNPNFFPCKSSGNRTF